VRSEDRDVCLGVLARHSKSFALAGRLLPPRVREQAAAVYAWCRTGDDAVDATPPAATIAAPDDPGAAVVRARDSLREIYEGEEPADPVGRAFREVVRERRIPRLYPDEMLAGFEMDARGTRYLTVDDLALYCYRVAGTVGLMMCHVMGVGDARALRPAAQLGMAMQLTNICRDVLEDWDRGRVYLPDELLGAGEAERLRACIGEPLPAELDPALRRAVSRLLELAGPLYRSGDEGLRWLRWPCALSARTARLVYSAIGDVITRRGCDVRAGRAVVSTTGKIGRLARALGGQLLDAPRRLSGASSSPGGPEASGVPTTVLPFSTDLVRG